MSRYSGESGRRADPEVVVDRINRERARAGVDVDAPRDPTKLNWDDPDHRASVRRQFKKNGDVDEAMLPGFGPRGLGENARDDCGETHPFVCDECGHNVDFGRTCSQSACSRCGVAWARDLGISKAAKIRRVRIEKNQHTSEHQFLHHQIISPSLSWFADLARGGATLAEALETTDEVVKFILDEMRAQGILIRHSFRGAHDDGSTKSEDDDRGIWKERLNSGRKFYGDVREEIAWKPHYHCLVVSDFLRGDGFSDIIEEATEWVVHRITNDDGVSLANDGAAARAICYSLSHADILVRDDGPNRSVVREVGAFAGDGIRNSSRFAATPSDLDWADGVVRRISPKILGLKSGSTDCGTDLPPVDDPDRLARRILDELFPKDEPPARLSTDAVLAHVSAGNISVDVSTTSGGGGSVTVRDAFGEPIGADGFGGSVPSTPDGSRGAVRTIVDDRRDDGDDCDCCDDGDNGTCSGTLIPLGEARQRGLLDDDDWCSGAAFVDEAREADREWSDDLAPWRTSSPGSSIGVT